MLFNWKSIFIGFSLAIVLYILLKIIFGTAGSFLGIIMASLIVGYTSNEDLTSGIIHGAIIGAFGGISLEIFTLIAIKTLGGSIWALIMLGKATAIDSIIIWTGLGLMGGAIGTMITKRSPEMETMKNERKVTLNIENIQKCACPQCPVQAESKCVQNKIYMLKEMMKMEKDIMPEPENIPEIYCATRITSCSDLNLNKECKCHTCDVWKENNLTYIKKTGYFCLN